MSKPASNKAEARNRNTQSRPDRRVQARQHEHEHVENVQDSDLMELLSAGRARRDIDNLNRRCTDPFEEEAMGTIAGIQYLLVASANRAPIGKHSAHTWATHSNMAH